MADATLKKLIQLLEPQQPTELRCAAVRVLGTVGERDTGAGKAVCDLLADPVQHHVRTGDETSAQAISTDAWDEALVQTQLAELLRSPGATGSSPSTTSTLTPTAQTVTTDTDPVALASGLSQLNKYLNKSWFGYGGAISGDVHPFFTSQGAIAQVNARVEVAAALYAASATQAAALKVADAKMRAQRVKDRCRVRFWFPCRRVVSDTPKGSVVSRTFSLYGQPNRDAAKRQAEVEQ